MISSSDIASLVVEDIEDEIRIICDPNRLPFINKTLNRIEYAGDFQRNDKLCYTVFLLWKHPLEAQDGRRAT